MWWTGPSVRGAMVTSGEWDKKDRAPEVKPPFQRGKGIPESTNRRLKRRPGALGGPPCLHGPPLSRPEEVCPVALVKVRAWQAMAAAAAALVGGGVAPAATGSTAGEGR